jgi:hypothetical protein
LPVKGFHTLWLVFFVQVGILSARRISSRELIWSIGVSECWSVGKSQSRGLNVASSFHYSIAPIDPKHLELDLTQKSRFCVFEEKYLGSASTE